MFVFKDSRVLDNCWQERYPYTIKKSLRGILIPSKAARYVFMKCVKCVKLTKMREMREIDRKAAREKPKKKPRITQEISWGFLCEVGGFHYDFSAFSRVIAVQDFAARKIVFFGPYCGTCLSELACTVFMADHKGFSHC